MFLHFFVTYHDESVRRKKRREQKLLQDERQRLETERARVSTPLPVHPAPNQPHSPLPHFPHPSQWPNDVRAFVYGPPSPDENGDLPHPLISWDDDVADTFPTPAFLRPRDWSILRSDTSHPWRTIRRRKRRTRPHWGAPHTEVAPLPTHLHGAVSDPGPTDIVPSLELPLPCIRDPPGLFHLHIEPPIHTLPMDTVYGIVHSGLALVCAREFPWLHLSIGRISEIAWGDPTDPRGSFLFDLPPDQLVVLGSHPHLASLMRFLEGGDCDGADSMGIVWQSRRNCACVNCVSTKTESPQCTNPHKYYLKARALLNSLDDKWNPLRPQPEDDENEPLSEPIALEPNEVFFDPKITTKGTLADTFRIFTDGMKGATAPPDTRIEPEPDGEPVIVYTDGSATNNGKADARAGAGAYYGPNDVRNLAIRVPEELGPSNQSAEVLAIKETIETNPKDIVLKIRSDSKYAVDGLTKHLREWEKEGFSNTKNGHIMKVTTARLRSRKAPTIFKWVKGHSGIEGNERADRLADEGRQKNDSPIVDMQIPREILIPGAKLKNITQSSVYRMIRAQNMEKVSYQEALDRRNTLKNLVYAQDAATNTDGDAPTVAQIWSSVRHKDISRSIRFFLWMVVHEGYTLGDQWNYFSGFEDRGPCKCCGVPENMEHILTQCDGPGQEADLD
ncbi:hypothetical protein B0H13DRAFT_2356350 [Mycena leptocephala]|nr:hypothetical protein B0H13DRAFT_2356350 [Mycena leptocephala]